MEYQKNHIYFAQVAGSLEKYAGDELAALGAQILKEVPRGFHFKADKNTLYRILYRSRITQRVLAPMVSFNCHSEKYLYERAFKDIQWTKLFKLDDTFNIISNVSDSSITNSMYAGQILKDAICDQFRREYNARPDFSTKEADIVFNLHIRTNFVTISLDITGTSMHKRNYRKHPHSAPLQETLAAVMVDLSQWDGSQALIDIMCGSGTILAEALMKYCKIPAGFLRDDSSIKFLPDFDAALWSRVKKEENDKIIPLPKGLIRGYDINSNTIRDASDNLRQLPYGELVELKVSKFQDLPKAENRLIITNPPYGQRLGNSDSIPQLYNELGDFLKQKCPNSISFILCGSSSLVSALRLRAIWKKNLKNGDLDTKFVKITVR